MNTIRLKNAAEVTVSNVDKKSAEGEIPVRRCNYTDVYYNDRITTALDFMEATATPEQVRAFQLRAGDVLLTKDSETPEDIAVPALVTSELPEVLCGYHLAILRARPGIDSRFLFWAIASQVTRQQFTASATGVTRFGLRADAYAEVRIPKYDLNTQRAIADYLDGQVDQIDSLIRAKHRLVLSMEERIDARVRMHIGESDLVQTESGRPTQAIKRQLRKMFRGADGVAYEMVTAFRDGQVTARSQRRAEGYTESWTDGSQVQGVYASDVVIHGLDGFAGAIGTAEVSGVCSPVYHVCTPTLDGDADFFGRLLRILAVSGYLGLFASSTRERAVDFRNWDLFGRIPVPLVDVSEQRLIGDAIRKMRPFRVSVERSALLAAERRQALITAAVMGQLPIPGLAA
jgi:type I restriction enzyme, S subunit